MYTFSIPVSVLSITPPQHLVFPCYFCQVKIFKTPLSHQPERRFKAHELSIHLPLEAIHNWQHRNICSKFPYGRGDDNASVKASSVRTKIWIYRIFDSAADSKQASGILYTFET